MKISVIIVSYNARYYLEQCLNSVQDALTNWEGEIIVIDNDSPEKPIPQIKDRFPSVNFIESNVNLGFAKANNLGVESASGEFVLILNPDTVLPETIFDEMIPFAENTKNVGAMGVRLIDANGSFHPESKRNIPTLKNTFGKLFGTLIDKNNSKSYYKSEIGEFEIAPTEVLVGAFMLMKKSVYEKVGGFDDQYFMYGEDIDLSYTLTLNGFTNYYFGQSTVIHYKGESTRKDKKYLKIFFGAMQVFIEKYYKRKPIHYLLFSIGLKLRYFWAKLNGGFKRGDGNNKPQVKLSEMMKIKSRADINERTSQYLLEGSFFSNSEMIQIISENYKPNQLFYIHPKKMDVIIGDFGVIIP